MNIRVVDAKGKTVMASRDLGAIRREFAGQAEQLLVRLPEGPFNRSGIFHWDFGPLPESVAIEHDGRTLTVFPALNDENAAEDVSIRPFANPERACEAHAAGLRRLFFLHTHRECRSLIQTMPGIEKLTLLHKALTSASYAGGRDRSLVEELAELTAHRAWEGVSAPDVRAKEQFDARLNAAWTRIGGAGAAVFALAEAVVREHMAIAPMLADAAERPEYAATVLDLRVQLAYLFPDRFWTRTPFQWLEQYPRYLGGIRRRLDKLGAIEGVARDTRLLNEIAPWTLKLRIRVEQGAPSQRADPDLILFRWMLEEYRVALWGAQGGRQETLVPVSAKRLEEQWGSVVGKDP